MEYDAACVGDRVVPEGDRYSATPDLSLISRHRQQCMDLHSTTPIVRSPLLHFPASLELIHGRCCDLLCFTLLCQSSHQLPFGLLFTVHELPVDVFLCVQLVGGSVCQDLRMGYVYEASHWSSASKWTTAPDYRSLTCMLATFCCSCAMVSTRPATLPSTAR